MARLTVPTVACVIGEGGSGGAIAIALADRVLMQENAIYSVISPEGCAAILWRDAGQAKKAAAAFRPDAVHCLELGVIDEIVPEPVGGAHIDPDMAARLLGAGVAGIARRARRDSRRRSASPAPRALPLARRVRLSSFRQVCADSAASDGDTVHSVHRLIPAMYSLCKRQAYNSRDRVNAA